MDTLVVCPKCEKLNRVPLERADQSKPICGHCQSELPVKHGIQELNASTLTALIQKSSRPVVVDFWAPWCGPCRAFAPVYQQAAKQLAGAFVFAKADTEAHPATGAHYQVRGIPTLIVFRNGIEKGRQSGAMALPDLLAYLKAL